MILKFPEVVHILFFLGGGGGGGGGCFYTNMKNKMFYENHRN